MTLPAALLPMVVWSVTSVFSEPDTVTPALMLRTPAEPLPETVAVVSISVSSIDVGARGRGRAPLGRRPGRRHAERLVGVRLCSAKKECEDLQAWLPSQITAAEATGR